MSKKVRSARGQLVDFDLLKIKQQIADSPQVDVTARENFVERRLRRRTKRTAPPVVTDPIDQSTEDTIDPPSPRSRSTKKGDA